MLKDKQMFDIKFLRDSLAKSLMVVCRIYNYEFFVNKYKNTLKYDNETILDNSILSFCINELNTSNSST